jgi:hypothetical protein
VGLDATALPSAVYNALNNSSVTAAFTELLPGDAKFENCRVLPQLNPVTYGGLGYGKGTTCTTLIGTPILSSFLKLDRDPGELQHRG